MRNRKVNSPNVHLNLNVRGLSQSATLGVNKRSTEIQNAGGQVFRLGLGQSPFPVPQVVVEALQANAHQKDYMPVKGLHELREAIAKHHRRKQHVDCSAEDVLVGPGSKELMFLLQLVYYGDLVIPTPTWVSYAPQAHIIGRQIRWVPTRQENDWRMTFLFFRKNSDNSVKFSKNSRVKRTTSFIRKYLLKLACPMRFVV